MSIVLAPPPPPLDELLLGEPPLLQPTAARAIAARAAIAGIRLMIFLSLIRVVGLLCGTLTDPACASWPFGNREMNGLTSSSEAAGSSAAAGLHPGRLVRVPQRQPAQPVHALRAGVDHDPRLWATFRGTRAGSAP